MSDTTATTSVTCPSCERTMSAGWLATTGAGAGTCLPCAMTAELGA